MKKLRSIRTILLILGIACIVLTMFPSLHDGGGTTTYETVEFPAVNNLRISFTALDMSLHSYDGDVIRITYSNALPLQFDTSEEGVLRITQDASFSLALFAEVNSRYHADIYLPRRSYRDFRLDSISGDIFVYDIDMLSLDITTRSGQTLVTNSAYPITITSQRGDVWIDAATVNGDINVKTGSGATSLAVPDFSSFTLCFGSLSGCITTDIFPEKYDKLREDVTAVYGTGRNAVNVESESGDLIIELTE